MKIAERLDRLPLTKLHLGIFLLCTFGLFADIAEVALSNAFSAIFLAPPYSISRSELSLLLGAVFAGGAVGAPIFGWFADRSGRRVALQLALAVVAASSLAVAACQSVGQMMVFRFVSGLALGAYPPLTAAYLSDILPPRRRGMLMMLCAALAFLGAPAVILLIRWLTPLAPLEVEGWRWALILGGSLAAATACLFFLAPESPRWLATLGRNADADRTCRRFEVAASVAPPSMAASAEPASASSGFRALAADRGHVGRAVLLAALYMLGPWATIGFPLLSAAVMVQKGFHVSESLLFAGMTMLGPTVGNAAIAMVIDSIGRRVSLVLCSGVMILAGIVFALGSGFGLLIGAGFVFNLTSAVYSAVLSIYGAELFPTNLRASATAGVWGLGRVVSAFVPVVLLPLLGQQGPLAMFGIISAALLASLMLILVAGPPGLARQPVP